MIDGAPYQTDRIWAQPRDLRGGESIAGTVLQLPPHGAFFGNMIVLEPNDGEPVALWATYQATRRAAGRDA